MLRSVYVFFSIEIINMLQTWATFLFQSEICGGCVERLPQKIHIQTELYILLGKGVKNEG